MLRLQRRRRESGFTLIELLIVVAIIGILASMLIPNLLDALQKAKQKRTMADQRFVGTAMMSWLTDRSQAGAAGASVGQIDMGDFSVIAIGDLEEQLVPRYIQAIPLRDGWKNSMDYRLDEELIEDDTIMAIRSAGLGNIWQGDSYTPGSFEPTDYEQDIVWTDGFFVRWPYKLSS